MKNKFILLILLLFVIFSFTLNAEQQKDYKKLYNETKDKLAKKEKQLQETRKDLKKVIEIAKKRKQRILELIEKFETMKNIDNKIEQKRKELRKINKKINNKQEKLNKINDKLIDLKQENLQFFVNAGVGVLQPSYEIGGGIILFEKFIIGTSLQNLNLKVKIGWIF